MARRGPLESSLSLSLLSLTSTSITQSWHEYKWRLVKSRDRVPVKGFLLGLWQQCSPNGFSLTGFNHVPWYPLKRMQIVNQTSLSFLLASPSFPAVFTSFSVIILQSLTLLLLPIFLHFHARPRFSPKILTWISSLSKKKWTSTQLCNVYAKFKENMCLRRRLSVCAAYKSLMDFKLKKQPA